MTPEFSPVAKLSPAHGTEEFDCREPALDRFLKQHALPSQRANSAQTYVACRNNRVVGYYTLVAASAEYAEAPDRIRRGIARHPVPLILIARLAVDRRKQGRGLGKALLKDALLRSANAADIAGVRAVVVHAKNEKVRNWYKRFGFEPSPTDPLHLFLLMKEIKAILR